MTFQAEDQRPPVVETAATTRGPASLYTAELAGRILREVASGRTLHDVCHDEGIPAYTTVQGWIAGDRDGFAARYAEARERGRTIRKRAPLYPEDIEERILHELESGRPLCDICLGDDMPAPSTVRLWISRDREGFGARYAEARKIGRPPLGGNRTLYTAELADRLLDELAEGRTLTNVCDDPAMPSRSTVRLWVRENREGFALRYSQAREFGYHMMIDELIDIADDGRNDFMERRRKGGSVMVFDRENIKRSRLRSNVRCWLLSNALPKLYGDMFDWPRLAVAEDGEPGA
jgi:hypothetical protein